MRRVLLSDIDGTLVHYIEKELADTCFVSEDAGIDGFHEFTSRQVRSICSLTQGQASPSSWIPSALRTLE